MRLPGPQVFPTEQDLGFSVPHRATKELVTLLKGVNFVVQPATVTALMGASGAGKTTLIDVIAKRKTQGRMQSLPSWLHLSLTSAPLHAQAPSKDRCSSMATDCRNRN
eukprot:scaffold4595_cov415-Prasinococcus_capsulatus_cf.AAC.7